MPRILVTGGTRSGKSAHAEALLADRPAVTYVATGPRPGADDDPAWAARVRAHRDRRPTHWSTLETSDLRDVPAAGAVLVDSLGTWIAAQLDQLAAWETTTTPGAVEWRRRSAAALDVLGSHPDLVVVSEEVGLGGLRAHPSARLFADLIGELNQAVAARCDEVHLVVAGRVLRL